MKPVIIAAVLALTAAVSTARAGDFEYAGHVGIVYLDASGSPVLEVPEGPDGRRPLEPGAAVAVVIFDPTPGAEQQLVHAMVARGPVKPPRPERQLYLPDSGVPARTGSYALAGIDGAVLTGAIGLGVVGAGDCRISGGAALCDLEPGGLRQSFRVCAGIEGLLFTVWTGAPLKGAMRWSVYYYLGYDIEPDCTEKDHPE